MDWLRTIISSRSNNTIRKRFKHVNCRDNDVSQYFRDELAAKKSIEELNQRSWEYRYEFVTEMSKQCKAAMGENKEMKKALDIFDQWCVTTIVAC